MPLTPCGVIASACWPTVSSEVCWPPTGWSPDPVSRFARTTRWWLTSRTTWRAWSPLCIGTESGSADLSTTMVSPSWRSVRSNRATLSGTNGPAMQELTSGTRTLGYRRWTASTAVLSSASLRPEIPTVTCTTLTWPRTSCWSVIGSTRTPLSDILAV